jgi:pimeloyl-ACP methyl ester carboxylesterase
MQAQMIKIGPKRHLALYRLGKGSPTIVFETGMIAEAREWEPIMRELAQFASVCCYDRVGRGGSDAGPQPRNAINCAEDLHTLLLEAEVPQPYLLVGQSLGGFIVRAFAALYPEEVSGVILVDASHEDQFELIANALPPESEMDDEGLKRLRNFWSAGYRSPDNNLEGFDFPATFEQMRQLPSLGNIPLTIISAGSGWSHLPVSDEKKAELQRISAGLQSRFLDLSTSSQQVIAEGSGHFVQRDCPEVIVEVVKAHLEQLNLL